MMRKMVICWFQNKPNAHIIRQMTQEKGILHEPNERAASALMLRENSTTPNTNQN